MDAMRWLVAVGTGVCLMAAHQAMGQAAAAGAADKVLAVKNLYGLESNARLRTPVFNVNGGGKIVRSTPGNLREWVQLVAEYYTAPDPKERWLDKVAFQFYVLTALENRETKRPEYTLFRGTVTYQDVDRNRRDAKWATLFLRPSVIPRYGDVAAIAVEVSANDRPMDSRVEVDRKFQDILKNEKEWWKNPKLPVKDGYLLKAGETPFGNIGYDDYDEIAH